MKISIIIINSDVQVWASFKFKVVIVGSWHLWGAFRQDKHCLLCNLNLFSDFRSNNGILCKDEPRFGADLHPSRLLPWGGRKAWPCAIVGSAELWFTFKTVEDVAQAGGNIISCFFLVLLVVDWEEKLVPYLQAAGAQSVAVVSIHYSSSPFKMLTYLTKLKAKTFIICQS